MPSDIFLMFIEFSTLTQALEASSRFDNGDCRRLLHGRGGAFPTLEGLTLDWYPPLLHLICYQPPDAALIQQLARWLSTRLHPQPKGMILQRRDLPGAPQQLVWGELPQETIAREAGLSYQVHFDRGQNIGFFPDMAVGRQFVRDMAKGKRVLNLVAYTCSLSVAAVAGGAQSVVNLDMSRNALDWGRHNHRLNALDQRRVSFLAHDLFKSFGKLRRLGPFDLIIADPPDTQGDSFRPERDWPRLLRRLPELLTSSGELLACMSVPRLGRSFLETSVF